MCMFPFIITTRCRFNTDVSHAICYWHRHKGVFVYSAICMREPGGCFTNVSRALQKNLAKIYNTRNYINGDNSKLKLCTCAQSMALGTRTKFQLELLIRSAISAIHKFRENILESSRNVSETTPGPYFTDVSRAVQNILSKFVYCRIRTSCENFKLKFCTCTQSITLKFGRLLSSPDTIMLTSKTFYRLAKQRSWRHSVHLEVVQDWRCDP